LLTPGWCVVSFPEALCLPPIEGVSGLSFLGNGEILTMKVSSFMPQQKKEKKVFIGKKRDFTNSNCGKLKAPY